MHRWIGIGGLVSATACSGGTVLVASGSPFAGTFECTTSQTTTFAEPAGAQPLTISETSTSTVSDLGNGEISVMSVTTGSASSSSACGPLTFSVSGGSATLDDGQSCMATTSDGTFTILFTSGQLSVAGDGVHGNFAGNMSGTAVIGGSSVPTKGTIASSQVCTRN